MRSGRPPKPTALKKLKGTLRKHRVNHAEWTPPPEAPPEPDDLDKVAQSEWRKAVDLLLPSGILTRADGRVLESYCRAVSRARAAETIVAAEGLTVESPNGLKAHPAVGIARQAWEAAGRFGERLGLDPSSRAKLHAPQAPKKDEAAEFLFAKAPVLSVVKGGGSSG